MKRARKVLATLAGLGILAMVLVVWLAPGSQAYRAEARGACELRFHNAGLGEPGRESVELWCRGKRLAERPGYTSVSLDGDEIIYGEDRRRSPDEALRGIYYFNARTARKQRLRAYAHIKRPRGMAWPRHRPAQCEPMGAG